MAIPRVPTVRLEIPDYDLGLRGKSVRADSLGSGKRAAMSMIVYGLSVADDVTDTPIANANNGYPDAFAILDESTRVQLPWYPATEAVIADMIHQDDRPVLESPRTVLKNLEKGFKDRGLTPILGYEYEVYVSHAGEINDGIVPLGRTISAYSLLRLAETSDLAEEFMARMEAINIPLGAFHSELGPGFLEFTLSPAPALEAADRAARAKQYFRELCAERGLRATFMAKLHMDQSGSGGHVHQSILHEGSNVFSNGNGELSELASQYLAGLVASMGDMTVLFNPFLNSYKRLDAAFFVANRATWGYDNRNAACRTILNVPAEAARVEHRRPGADASPYLVAIGILAGGLYGISEKLKLGPALMPDDDIATSGQYLAATLEEAVDAFEASAIARDYVGADFVASYAATRRGELAAFSKWWRGNITDWELKRYMEHI